MTAGCPIIMLWEIFICIKAFKDFLGFHNSDQRKYLRQRGDPSIELGLTPDKTSCTRKIKSEAITAVTALFAGFLPGSKPVWLVISQKSNVFNLATRLNWGNNFQRYRHHLSHLEIVEIRRHSNSCLGCWTSHSFLVYGNDLNNDKTFFMRAELTMSVRQK